MLTPMPMPSRLNRPTLRMCSKGLSVGGARRARQIGRRTFLRRAALAGTGAALAGALPMSVASASMGNLTRRTARFRDLIHVSGGPARVIATW